MNDESLSCLKRLLATPGPSSDEAAAARVWRSEARSFADQVYADVRGNSHALLVGQSPTILLASHIDEIGLMVSSIDDEGFLAFDLIGGWDTQVLVGQRVRLLTPAGEVLAVVGKKPVHLLNSDERDSASKIDNLWLDMGARSGDEVRAQVPLGTVGVIDAPLYELPNGRLVSRSLDNRIGAFVVLEALRRLATNRPTATVVALASTQEEVSSSGAAAAAFRHTAELALVVDVTFATDHPESNKRRDGDVRLGGGPVLSRGAANSPLVYARLIELAAREQIPYSVQITPRFTGTDADRIYHVGSGIATALISIPNRYMHSPNEMIDLADVEHAVNLMVAFVQSVRATDEFIEPE
jgi:endoglucanase